MSFYSSTLQFSNSDSALLTLKTLSLLFILVSFSAEGDSGGITAFYYGSDVPADVLSLYDNVVVEPSSVKSRNIEQLQDAGVSVFAYLSVGEVDQENWNRFNLPDDLVLGKNNGWDSIIVDPDHRVWKDYLLEQHIPALVEKGYQGLFLDTLDSYQILNPDDSEKVVYQKALIALIAAINTQFPDLKLMVNRGFELFPEITEHVDHLVAESLFQTFSPGSENYYSVPAEDRIWLLEQLKRIQSYGIPVTVIDYLPVEEMASAKALAGKIQEAGFSAWVSTPELDFIGVSSVIPVPRKIMILYNEESGIHNSDVHISMASVVEYLGYVPEYVNVDEDLLPEYPLTHRVAGIISWLSETPSNPKALQNWLKKQIAANIPTLFFTSLPITDPKLLQKMGVARTINAPEKSLRIIDKSRFTDYESIIKPTIRGTGQEYSRSATNTPWLTLEDKGGQVFTPIILAPWGGMALGSYVFFDNGAGKRSWYIDPFEFLIQGLKLQAMPAFDTTTENGRRILTSHVDGDGFASRAELPGTPYSGEIIRDEIFKSYDIPHTVSIVEGEVGAEGLYPNLTEVLEPIARDIFRLPNIELAGHSFSHPFFWQPEKKTTQADSTLYGFHLPIPGYKQDLEREILGSIDYINKRLAPENKKVKVFLWTGDALPSGKAVGLTKKAGVYNLNGGNSYITNSFPSISGLYPLGSPTEAGWQIYAPFINENVYTNDWTGPFYGYRKVIESFQLTDKDRRLKPMTIYWHFYSGTKYGALNALTDIYDWVLTQNPIGLYISEYAARAEGFYAGAIAQTGDGRWLLSNYGALRTVRVPEELGTPSMACSEGVAGYRDLPQGRYVHLSDNEAVLCFKENIGDQVVLDQTNVVIEYWDQSKKGKVIFRLAGHQPVEFTVTSRLPCLLKGAHGVKRADRMDGNKQFFTMTEKDTGHASLICQ